jgi:predicted nucleic acid-binding protein
MRRILIDTGAIYAFVVRNDLHHREAIAFTVESLATGGRFVLADLVFAETMTLLKARLGSQVALRVGRELRRNSAYEWVPMGQEGEEETWATFQRFGDKPWSYTDCALWVLGKRLRVNEIFAFDQHFSQMPAIVRLP